MSRLCGACLCVLLASLGSGQERPRESFREVAGRMVKAINAADYEGVRKDFNKTMLDAFPVERCRTFFSMEISAKFGKINKLEPPQFKSAAEAVFVARCERGTLDFTLLLDEQGRVAGMLFRPRSDLPVPEKNQTELALPFNGRWLVLWGGDTAELNYHHHDRAQRFAFDLSAWVPTARPAKGTAAETRTTTPSAARCLPQPTASSPM